MQQRLGEEWVTRADMVMFVNACFASTGQREFYGSGPSAVSIQFLHSYILGNYRKLYARTLAAGINHWNIAQIIVNLLGRGSETRKADREEEGELIYRALLTLPPQRAYRVLGDVRYRGINNRRARAVTKRYLARHADMSFEAVKYRAKMRRAVQHAHVKMPGELGPFLFRGWLERKYTTPLLESFRQAHFAESAVYELPFSIAEGFAAKHKIPRARLLERLGDSMTVGERMRLQNSAAEAGVDVELDLGRIPLTKLALYILSLDADARRVRHDELARALHDASVRALKRTPKRLGRVAAVLDRSYSTSGSSEKRRRPLAVALAADALLRTASQDYKAFWTTVTADPLMLTPSGQTDLATPLLDALRWKPDLVIIVSDGYENSPPTGAAEIARVFRERLDPERNVSIVHMNPVFDDENYMPRTIGAAIPTVGLRDAEDLLTMLGFARFADGSAPLTELEDYLATRVRTMLAEGHA